MNSIVGTQVNDSMCMSWALWQHVGKGLHVMSGQQVANELRFPSTQWSLVGRAGQLSPQQRREALGIFLDRYLPALRAHLVLGKRISGDLADDLLQGFIADKIVEQNLLAHAEQTKGRFRSFLVGALNHYLISHIRHETAQKRCPSERILNIGDQFDVCADMLEPSEHFTLMWAREIVEQARRLTEVHCRKIDRPDLWRVLDERILRPASHDGAAAPHGQIASELHLQSSKAASNLLITAKRLFARMLRLVVGEYAGAERQIDEEIDDLMRILSEHRS